MVSFSLECEQTFLSCFIFQIALEHCIKGILVFYLFSTFSTFSHKDSSLSLLLLVFVDMVEGTRNECNLRALFFTFDQTHGS